MFHFFCKKFSERCYGRGFLFPVYLVLSCLLVISLAAQEQENSAGPEEPTKTNAGVPIEADTGESAEAVSEEPTEADTGESTEVGSEDSEESVSEAQEYTYDTPPIRAGVQQGVSSFYSDGNITYARSNTKIKLSSTERISAVKQIQYKVDESAYQAYVSPITIDEEGQHQISYRSLDIVGNVEFESMVTVIIDNTPPAVSVASNVSFVKTGGDIYVPGNRNPQLYIRANDFYSGVKAIQYYVRSASEASEEKGAEKFSDYLSGISLEAPGEKLIVYRAVDNLGNISESKKIKIITDATPPSIQINFIKKLILHEDKKYSVKNNKLILSADDEASGVASIYVKLSADEGFQPYVEPISMADHGEYNIEAKAIDRVGNESQIISESIIMDAEPPQTTLEFLSDVNEGSSSEPVTAPDDAEETTEDTEKPNSEEEEETEANAKEESATVEETDTSEEKEEAATEE